MEELKGLEKIAFTRGKHSPTTQFTKKFVQAAATTFRSSDYLGIGSNIFTSGDGVYCFGVKSKFEVSDCKTNLTVTDRGYSGCEEDQESVEDLVSNVVSQLTDKYSISNVKYK
jgi:hypothetical protein